MSPHINKHSFHGEEKNKKMGENLDNNFISKDMDTCVLTLAAPCLFYSFGDIHTLERGKLILMNQSKKTY